VSAPAAVGAIVRALALCGLALVVMGSTDRSPGEEPAPIPFADPIKRLQTALDDGSISLEYDAERGGFLPSLLEVLDIPVSSQTLVFSRTSLQVDRITPWTPRALYFNDDLYVGFVQDGPIIEIASMDPQDGALFYTLTQREEGPIRFRRGGTQCLQCHESRVTDQLPGLIMRSTLVDRYGYPIDEVHDGSSRDTTPLAQRWGGWYVTGSHGGQTHAGNVHSDLLYEEITDPDEYIDEFDLTGGANLTDLSGHMDVSPYLSPHSDIVALMVLAHQVRVHNLVSQAKAQGSRVLGGLAAQKSGLRFSIDDAAASNVGVLDRLLRALVFVGEARLTDPVRGTSTFAEDFPLPGPTDPTGRSLRDLDLDTRLFRYPVSFLIYSDSFHALPDFTRNYLYDGLQALLTAEELPPLFDHLLEVDREATLEILKATLPDFARRVDGPQSP
jgi:hypothetical protein